MESNFPQTNIQCHLVSVTNQQEMKRLLRLYRPEIVFHAAAYKHVALLERHPGEGIFNNIEGLIVTVDACEAVGVENFVLVSTDKAVQPTNVMGVTKRIGELLVQEVDARSNAKYCSVRFGNVLGSNGSVIPIFEKQILQGGPITVTDPNATRFFMSVQEAASLIIAAGSHCSGGEIYVLDMGDPLKILDLAESMAYLSGRKPYEDIDIVFTGLGEGEKLSESLFASGESLIETDIEKLLMVKEIYKTPNVYEEVKRFLALQNSLNEAQARKQLYDLIKQ